MWPDNDTLVAFEDEKDRKMRIKDDTQGAFGDPDIREQFLQEFRAMRLGDEGRSPPRTSRGLRGYFQAKILRKDWTKILRKDRTVQGKMLCGNSYTNLRSWMQPLLT